jgi:phage I-like protein
MADALSIGASAPISDKINANDAQWVHVLPFGTVSGRDGRGPYTLVDAQAVMDETRRYHGKTQMLVDFEHQSVNAVRNGKPAPAAGWINTLQAREDGIWALVKWTPNAAKSIRQQAYRYLSPVFHHDARGRVLRLLNVALTNTPNLDLTAVARSEVFSMNETQLAELRDLLGLVPDADFSAVRDAIAALMQSANSSTPDPTKFVPIGDFERVVAEGNKLRQGVSLQAAEAHVAGLVSSGALAPFLKDWAVNLCSINKPHLDGFMERTGPFFTQMMVSQIAGRQRPKSTSRLSDDQLAVCHAMGLTEAEFINASVGE